MAENPFERDRDAAGGSLQTLACLSSLRTSVTNKNAKIKLLGKAVRSVLVRMALTSEKLSAGCCLQARVDRQPSLYGTELTSISGDTGSSERQWPAGCNYHKCGMARIAIRVPCPKVIYYNG